jgi:hypothetical protein
VAISLCLLQALAPALPAIAAPATITIVVQDATTHAAITEFTYLVNLDNTGDPD